MNRCISPANTNGIYIDYIAKFVYSLVIKQGGVFMPTIRSNADLKKHYNEISTFCHNYTEPVFITKNVDGIYVYDDGKVRWSGKHLPEFVAIM